MRLLIAYLLVAISTALAIIDTYVRLKPPKVDTVPTEPPRHEPEAPLRSGTEVKQDS